MYVGDEASLRILLSLCRADLCGQSAQDAIFPSSDAAWMSLLAYASNHGLVGLLYRTAANLNCISPTALAPIRSAAHAQTARSCYLANELLEIVATLRGLHINAVALKGPVLTHFYGHISAREFCDLDLLVHRSDLAQAGLVLKQRGYRTDPRNYIIGDVPREDQHHAVFIRDEDGSRVELHWALTANLERTPIDATDVWSRIEPVLLRDQHVLTLGIEDTLLYLCAHAFKHRWCRLKWVTDIAYVLRSEEQIDWDALISRARRTGCYRMLLVGLSLASSLLGSMIPSTIARKTAEDRTASGIVEQISSALLSDRPLDDIAEMTYELRARDRFQDQFVLSFRLLRRICRLTDEDGITGRQPVRRQLTAFFKRPMRLYRTYGLAWVKPVFRLR